MFACKDGHTGHNLEIFLLLAIKLLSFYTGSKKWLNGAKKVPAKLNATKFGFQDKLLMKQTRNIFLCRSYMQTFA